ncbi:hypothetical protein MTO96_043102 [Rhipicephalus appendiculatus]
MWWLGFGSEPAASVDDLRKLAVPSRSWALHEFPELNGVAYVACKLNLHTRFFKCADDGGFDCEVFVRNKTVEKCHFSTHASAVT